MSDYGKEVRNYVEAAMIIKATDTYNGEIGPDLFTLEAQQNHLFLRFKNNYTYFEAFVTEPWMIIMTTKLALDEQRITPVVIKSVKREFETMINWLNDAHIVQWRGYRNMIKVLRQPFDVPNGIYSSSSYLVGGRNHEISADLRMRATQVIINRQPEEG